MKKTISSPKPNAGIEVAFQKALDRMVEDMHRSLMKWLSAAYRAKPPKLAQDAEYVGSSAEVMNRLMQRLARRWLKRFDDAAPELARYFATAAFARSDKDLQMILRKAGFSVKFQMSRVVQESLQANIHQNVSLIKSIAEQHLSEVEGMVMRSVTAGRDLHQLQEDLIKRYGITRRRAALISRSQNNLASANIQRVRQIELGITEMMWVHSAAGREPRPSHVKAGKDKLTYDPKQGALIDGEYIFPGEKINCRCYSRMVLPDFKKKV